MSIYQKYCREIMDCQGNLEKFTLEFPDNFNFGYDVVDAVAGHIATRWQMSSIMPVLPGVTG